jgi:hypothetical protein
MVDGNKLSWHDASRTCCSKYACVRAHHNAVRNAKPKPRFPGWGFGAIIDELKREQRRKARSRKKGKAA